MEMETRQSDYDTQDDNDPRRRKKWGKYCNFDFITRNRKERPHISSIKYIISNIMILFFPYIPPQFPYSVVVVFLLQFAGFSYNFLRLFFVLPLYGNGWPLAANCCAYRYRYQNDEYPENKQYYSMIEDCSIELQDLNGDQANQNVVGKFCMVLAAVCDHKLNFNTQFFRFVIIF